MSKNITGFRSGKLVARKTIGKNKNGYLWECDCDCGNICSISTREILGRRRRSCGCSSQNDLTESRFGKLVVVEKTEERRHRKIVWLCKCDCGRYTKVISCDLINNKTKSCGNCSNMRNGVKTSFLVIELHKMIGIGCHNFKSRCGACIDIALARNRTKIAIEYDGWYWHANKRKHDKNRLNKLKLDGWKILRIKSNMKIPDKNKVLNSIYKLYSSQRKIITITLDDWGNGPYKEYKK